MLQVDQLRVDYGPTRAVDDLTLTVEGREAVALLGPNGAGKTSTLRAISQLVAYHGTVHYEGQSLHGLAPERLARRGLIHVPEGRHVFPTLTVHENFQMGQTASAGRHSDYRIDDVYDLFPALTTLHRRPGYALSGGEQQMVAIGRALVAAPRLLLLDEPSLGLAPIVAKAVFAALDQIRHRTPLLLVEQNTQLALQICQRAHILVDGRPRLAGDAADLTDREALLASYLGQTDAVETTSS